MSSVEDFSYIADSCREQANTTSRDLLDSPPAAKKKKVINLRQYARQPGEGIKKEIKEEYKEEIKEEKGKKESSFSGILRSFRNNNQEDNETQESKNTL